MRKITIANRKGGVGKTTTAVNVATGLALAGIWIIINEYMERQDIH